MKITDEMVSKACDAYVSRAVSGNIDAAEGMHAALSAVAPLIRSAALEEAARVLVDMAKENEIARDCFKALSEHEHSYRHEQYRRTILANAESIRALKDKPNE